MGSKKTERVVHDCKRCDRISRGILDFAPLWTCPMSCGFAPGQLPIGQDVVSSDPDQSTEEVSNGRSR